KLIGPYLRHDKKKALIVNKEIREFSHTKVLSENEQEQIISVYKSNRKKGGSLFKGVLPFDSQEKKRRNNLSGCVGLLRRNNSVGIGALKAFKNENLISEEKLSEICQRITVTSITADAVASG